MLYSLAMTAYSTFRKLSPAYRIARHLSLCYLHNDTAYDCIACIYSQKSSFSPEIYEVKKLLFIVLSLRIA